MIKCEVVEKFDLKAFNKLKNIERADKEHESKKYDGSLFINDIFECDKEMAEYLTGENALKKTVVKIIEVQPEKVEDYIIKDAKIEYINEETKPKATIKKKKTSKKKVKE